VHTELDRLQQKSPYPKLDLHCLTDHIPDRITDYIIVISKIAQDIASDRLDRLHINTIGGDAIATCLEGIHTEAYRGFNEHTQ
jgi:hypothetical protein